MTNREESSTELVKVMENLTEKEVSAYNYAKAHRQLPVSDDRNDTFYDLFRHGKSCDDIRKINPGFSLGQIVTCRITGEWDIRLEKERADLLKRLPGQAMHAQADAVDYLTRLLSVNHKLYGPAMDKFLETGDRMYLKDLPKGFGDVREYRSILESLLKATGFGNRKVVEHQGTVNVTQMGPASSEEAGTILDVIAIPVPDKEGK